MTEVSPAPSFVESAEPPEGAIKERAEWMDKNRDKRYKDPGNAEKAENVIINKPAIEGARKEMEASKERDEWTEKSRDKRYLKPEKPEEVIINKSAKEAARKEMEADLAGRGEPLSEEEKTTLAEAAADLEAKQKEKTEVAKAAVATAEIATNEAAEVLDELAGNKDVSDHLEENAEQQQDQGNGEQAGLLRNLAERVRGWSKRGGKTGEYADQGIRQEEAVKEALKSSQRAERRTKRSVAMLLRRLLYAPQAIAEAAIAEAGRQGGKMERDLKATGGIIDTMVTGGAKRIGGTLGEVAIGGVGAADTVVRAAKGAGAEALGKAAAGGMRAIDSATGENVLGRSQEVQEYRAQKAEGEPSQGEINALLVEQLAQMQEQMRQLADQLARGQEQKG